MEFGVLPPEVERMTFINECEVNDIPRVKNTVFPEGCDVKKNIAFIDDGLDEHKFDIYSPEGKELGDEAFFVIHGGAFVYGYKELDQDYSMRLVLKSNIPAVNTNYRLMPETDFNGSISDLCASINYANSEYGFKKLHITGDSAGGYLAVLMTLIIRSESVQKDLGVKINPEIEVLSVAPICGCYTGNKEVFPMCYFTKGDDTLPEYVYNLMDLIKTTGLPRTAVVTGDQDFLMDENFNFEHFLSSIGVPHSFYNATSHDDFIAHHVFPICYPYNDEGKTTIDLVVKNAIG
ncbi:MAG: alpha/beta hydrolase [Saccharofermentans sp.]|nr:alpha/beta hydrolase [Saccharofermentans sp.]